MLDKKAAIASIGCKVNKYEADAMAECLKHSGYEIVSFREKASIYIINTCTVTNMGDKKSRQLIRRAKEHNKDSIVVAAGCYSQVCPTEVAKIDGVDIVLGTKGYSEIAGVIDNYLSGVGEKGKSEPIGMVSDIETVSQFENVTVSKQPKRARAYVKVEDGCDNFCAYCIIPYARGKVRSRRLEDVVAEVRLLCENGVKEIVLTGIHVASYGKDLAKCSLIDLVKAVNDVNGLKRLRLSSLEPSIITENFVDTLLKLDKFCEHFHLSLQSGCDKTLASMNRKYTSFMYKAAVSLIRDRFPQSAIWTDVIAGFPGETDDDFEQTLAFIKNAGINKLHVFPYSPKKGTNAYIMENRVSDKVKAYRAAKLKELDDTLYTDFLNKNLSKEMSVLFEKKERDGFYSGHSSNYILVKTASQADISNKILTVRLVSICEKGVVLGES